jgi:nitroreductase
MTFKEKFGLVEGLKKRVSHPRLTEPAPTSDELSDCYQAAFRSPDHAWLRPWRFIECRGAEREALGELLADAVASEQPEASEAALEKLKKGPLRAPLVIVCYAELTEHPKVPAVEQVIAAGCAANNLVTALYGKGFGAVWRTGDAAHSPQVRERLKLPANAEMIGLIYVGTPLSDDKVILELDQSDFVTTFSQQVVS